MAKILIVDDDTSTLKLYRRFLEQGGYEVIETQNGIKVPELLFYEQPDFMICDLLMPERDGIETIADARNKYPNLIIIAISGGASDGYNSYLDMTKDLGANEVLVKPIKLDLLAKLISKYTVE